MNFPSCSVGLAAESAHHGQRRADSGSARGTSCRPRKLRRPGGSAGRTSRGVAARLTVPGRVRCACDQL